MQISKGAQHPGVKVSALEKTKHGIRMEGLQVAFKLRTK